MPSTRLPVPADQRPGPLPIRDGFGNIRLPVKGGGEVAITLGDAQRVAQGGVQIEGAEVLLHGAGIIVDLLFFDAGVHPCFCLAFGIMRLLRQITGFIKDGKHGIAFRRNGRFEQRVYAGGIGGVGRLGLGGDGQ